MPVLFECVISIIISHSYRYLRLQWSTFILDGFILQFNFVFVLKFSLLTTQFDNMLKK